MHTQVHVASATVLINITPEEGLTSNITYPDVTLAPLSHEVWKSIDILAKEEDMPRQVLSCIK